MAGSNLLTDYLGKGLFASRPATLTLASGATGIYYATDTGNTYAWDGSAWQQVNSASGLLTFAPQGRLTLVTATPIMTSDQTAKSTIYYSAFVGDKVPVNGALLTITSGEVSFGLDAGVPHVASGSIYDIFGVSSGGSLALGVGPAWSSSSSRGTGAGTTEIYRKNGIWVNKNSITNLWGGAAGVTNLGAVAADAGTYLGSIYATANGQTGVQYRPAAAAGGSNTIVGLFNAYNKRQSSHYSQDSTATWTYNTTTWRSANNSASNRVTWLDGLGDMFVRGYYYAASENNTSGKNGFIGVNFNATTGAPGGLQGAIDSAGNTSFVLPAPSFNSFVGLGLNYMQAMENTDGGISTWFGPSYNLLVLNIDG